MLAYSITPRSVNVLIDGRMRTIDNTHLNYDAIVKALKEKHRHEKFGFNDWLREQIDIKAFIAKYTQGKIAVGDNDQVYYAGQEIHSYAAERLIDMMRNGFDISPLAYFIERLMSNPEPGVQQDLFTWLESGNMPLTPDGCFLAFKKVDDNYRSYHHGPDEHCDHRIGRKPTMERSEVNNNRQQTCERGLHFCSYAYLKEYHGGSGHVVILKIAPEDVVAIPYDYNDTKGRAWTYEVVGEVPEDEAKQFFHAPVDNRYDKLADGEADVEIEDDDGDACDCPDCQDSGEEWPQLADVIDKHIAEVEQKEIGEAVRNETTSAKVASAAAKVMKDPKASKEAKSIAASALTQRPDKVPTFEHNGTKFTPKKVEKEVEKLGQRGFAAKYNVARSTVQGWLKKLRK